MKNPLTVFHHFQTQKKLPAPSVRYLIDANLIINWRTKKYVTLSKIDSATNKGLNVFRLGLDVDTCSRAWKCKFDVSPWKPNFLFVRIILRLCPWFGRGRLAAAYGWSLQPSILSIGTFYKSKWLPLHWAFFSTAWRRFYNSKPKINLRQLKKKIITLEVSECEAETGGEADWSLILSSPLSKSIKSSSEVIGGVLWNRDTTLEERLW